MTQAQAFINKINQIHIAADPAAVMQEAVDAVHLDAVNFDLSFPSRAEGSPPTLTVAFDDDTQVTLEITGMKLRAGA